MTLASDRQARFFLDYPATDDDILAERYDITVTEVRRLALRNQLRKEHHDWSAAAVKGHDGRRPASVRSPAPRPVIPAGDYCESCGCKRHHWPGCPRFGLDDRPLLPNQ